LRSCDPFLENSKPFMLWMQLLYHRALKNCCIIIYMLMYTYMLQKKLSIPGTISRVLKYIPELQKQVEGLIKRKDEILLRLSPQVDEVIINKESQRKKHSYNSGFIVSTSRLNDSEITIQISCYTVHKIPLSEILMCLENDGLFLLNVSSSQTFGGRIFYNLHLQVCYFP